MCSLTLPLPACETLYAPLLHDVLINFISVLYSEARSFALLHSISSYRIIISTAAIHSRRLSTRRKPQLRWIGPNKEAFSPRFIRWKSPAQQMSADWSWLFRQGGSSARHLTAIVSRCSFSALMLGMCHYIRFYVGRICDTLQQLYRGVLFPLSC